METEEFYEKMSKTSIATRVAYEIRVAIIGATEIKTLDAITAASEITLMATHKATRNAPEIATFDAIRWNK